MTTPATPLDGCPFGHGLPEVVFAPQPSPWQPDTLGYWVACPTCGLRGPWRPTAVLAQHAWNRQIHPPLDAQEK